MTTTLDLDTGQRITVTESADPRIGEVTYQVAGTRLSGAFVLYPSLASADPYPTALTVQYGTGIPWRWNDRADRPTVNGIPIAGQATIEPADVEQFTRWRCHATRHDDLGYRDIPDRSAAYVAAVIRALTRHWAARPDVEQLRQAAARHQAADRLRKEEQSIGRLRDKLAPQLDELAERERRADLLRALTAQHSASTGDADLTA